MKWDEDGSWRSCPDGHERMALGPIQPAQDSESAPLGDGLVLAFSLSRPLAQATASDLGRAKHSCPQRITKLSNDEHKPTAALLP